MLKHALLLTWLIQTPHVTSALSARDIPPCRPPPYTIFVPTSQVIDVLKKAGQTELLWFKINPSHRVVVSVFWNPRTGEWTGILSNTFGSCKGAEGPPLPPMEEASY